MTGQGVCHATGEERVHNPTQQARPTVAGEINAKGIPTQPAEKEGQQKQDVVRDGRRKK